MSVTEPPAGRPAAAAAPLPRILIVDDAFGSRQLLARVLQPHVRARMAEARDGVEAVDMFASAAPDVSGHRHARPGRHGRAAPHPRAGPAGLRRDGLGLRLGRPGARGARLGIGEFVVKPYSTQRILDVLRRYTSATGDTTLVRP